MPEWECMAFSLRNRKAGGLFAMNLKMKIRKGVLQ